MNKSRRLFKALKLGMRSEHGNCVWTVGKWKKAQGPLVLCRKGWHASEQIIDAMGYVSPEKIAEVEVRGDYIADKDKQVWSEMRVVRVWTWTKEDSVALAVFAARKVLDLYEQRYPGDKRVRVAVEAAEEWLRNPTAGAAAWAAALRDEVEKWIRNRIGYASEC